MSISQKFSDIADAIRAKAGTTATMTPSEMATAIANIPTGSSYDVGTATVSMHIANVMATEGHAKFFNDFKVKSMNNIFYYGIPTRVKFDGSAGAFNTQYVTDMSKAFNSYAYYDNGYTYVTDLENMNTSTCSNMTSMFYDANLKYIKNIGKGWNTANVTNMFSMFNGAKITGDGVKKLDLSGFNTSNVTNMASMFNNFSTLEELDISNFYFSNLTGSNASVYKTFTGCTALATIHWPSEVKLSNIPIAFDLSPCPLTHDCVLELFNALTDGLSKTIKLKGTSYSLMSEDEIAIATGKGYAVTQ